MWGLVQQRWVIGHPQVHMMGWYFTDGLPVSRGIDATRCGAPSLVRTACSRWLYWMDRRRDSH